MCSTLLWCITALFVVVRFYAIFFVFLIETNSHLHFSLHNHQQQNTQRNIESWVEFELERNEHTTRAVHTTEELRKKCKWPWKVGKKNIYINLSAHMSQCYYYSLALCVDGVDGVVVLWCWWCWWCCWSFANLIFCDDTRSNSFFLDDNGKPPPENRKN